MRTIFNQKFALKIKYRRIAWLKIMLGKFFLRPPAAGLRSASLALFICLHFLAFCFAIEPPFETFPGVVNSNDINVRSDSNVSCQIICKIKRDTAVEVVAQKYGWYKIKLPEDAVCYVKKNLFEPIGNKTAKAIGTNINIRLAPNEASAILGKIDNTEIITILSDNGDWYGICPTGNTFGWIYKKFVNKVAAENIIAKSIGTPFAQDTPSNEDIVCEGIIQPYGKVINRKATHKLITKDYDIYLLKGNPSNLNSLTYHKVRITGKPAPAPKQKYPVIEIIKMEALD